MRALKLILLAVALLITGAAAQTKTANTARSRTPAADTTSAGIVRQMDEAVDSIAERVLPAVVRISVSGFGPSQAQRVGESVIERQRGLGSGVIVDPDGYVITNAHVVTGAQRIQVVMQSVTRELIPGQTSLRHRQRSFEAKLLGVHRLTDLALLKIEEKNLPYIPLPEEYRARLGQAVLAIGTPEGLTTP
jgi:serine protease Do